MCLWRQYKTGKGKFAAIVIAASILIGVAPAATADCVFDYLADIPLDTQEQAAPGIIMFLLDDSGSMDFATMIEDIDYDEWGGINFFTSGGQFLPPNGGTAAYPFDDPGDQRYYWRDLDGDEHLYWQSQYYGINKMYYNPNTTYDPWPRWDDASINDDSPGWTDPNPNTSALDMDPDTARSNPMTDNYPFNLGGTYYSLTATGGPVLNDADIVMESGSVALEATPPTTTINFQQTYSTPPLVFATPTDEGGEPASLRIFNVTNTSCEIAAVEPNPADGPHAAMNIHYLAIEPGDHTLPDGTEIHVLEVDTQLVRKGTGGISGSEGWEDVDFTPYGFTSTPIVLTQIQTMNNESGNPPNGPSEPWLVTAVQNVSTAGAQVALDRCEVDEGSVTVDETIGLLVMEGGTSGSFTDYTGKTITYETIASGNNIQGWDDECEDVHFNNDYPTEPFVIAAQNSYDGPNGGWLRRCALDDDYVGLTVDEDQDNDDERNHTTEQAGILVFSTEGVVIPRAHYYEVNANGMFLINIKGDSTSGYSFDYFQVFDNNSDGKLDNLQKLTPQEAQNAGIVTGRTAEEERINFANWYSFYRKRELTAKNAIGNVVTSIQGVFIGFHSIHNRLMQAALPVQVTHDGVDVDETAALLESLYNDYNAGGGTPLRAGMDYVGEYFNGQHVPGDIYEIGGSDYTTSAYYPFFNPSDGGACEQAFTIAMTDGFWNYSFYGIGDEDGNGDTAFDGGVYAGDASNTLADIAMHYYENDLNTNMADLVPISSRDKATHQHMVTYGVSFGANGTLNPEAYSCVEGGTTCSASDTCTEASPCSCCPIWPDPGSGDNPRKIDDLYHASVNGRGRFLNAGNPEELIEAMETLKSDIQSRLGSAAAVATNTIQRQVGGKIYQGTYHTDNWFGDVVQKNINAETGEIAGSADWSADQQLDQVTASERVIITYDGSSGIAFNRSNASTIGLSGDLIDYLRGDPSNNQANGGSFRIRSSKLGDIVHSAPFFHDGVIYIGANDGMLHAFDADSGNSIDDGKELFGYVPKILVDAGNLDDLSSPDYAHKFYVDNTVHVRKTSSGTLLVGGLRKGGKGYYCLDVSAFSDPPTEGDAGSVVKWEYTASGDDDLGYSYSRAYIVRTEASDAGWVVIFGNGYDSVNEEAVLYVLNASDGTVIKKFETGVTGCNGLSSPAVIDVDFDGYVDFVYAGDLKGNLWKFDLRGATSSEWGFSYSDGTNAQPLVQVKNASGGQPITVEPDVMRMECSAGQAGYFAVFGTGQYIGTTDFQNTDTQTFYGVWDWQENWPEAEQAGKYLGVFNVSDSSPTLSNSPSAADNLTLLEQTATDAGGDWREFSENAISYFLAPSGDSDNQTDHAGWFFNLKDERARVIRNPMIRPGTGEDLAIATFISSVTSESPCAAGGYSWLYRVSVCSGAGTDEAQFNTNPDQDDVIDENDDKREGKTFDQMLYSPIQVGDHLYINDSTGRINEVQVPGKPEGMSYWRIIQ